MEQADRLALFIDNDEAFDALKTILLSAKKSIWILAWVFDPLTRLDPDRVRKSRDPAHVDRIGLLLRRQAALNPGLDVRILVWDMPFPIAASQLFGPHRGQVFFTGSRVKYHLDNTLPASACHHQKVVMVDGSVASASAATSASIAGTPPSTWTTIRAAACRRAITILLATRWRPWSTARAAEALGDLFHRPLEARRRARRWTRSEKPEEAPWPDYLTPDLRTCPSAICRTQPAWKGRPEVSETMLMHLASHQGGPAADLSGEPVPAPRRSSSRPWPIAWPNRTVPRW